VRAAAGGWSAAGWPKVLLVQVHLGSPNVAATWFASMLRLAVAIGAAMGLLVDRSSARASAGSGRLRDLAWLGVAGGFVALSLAVMGSLGGRLELAQARGLAPAWLSNLLGAVALAAVLSTGLFLLVQLSRRPLALASALVGAALTAGASVAAQAGWTLTGEGLELLASVAFLAAFAVYVVARPGDPPGVEVPLRTAVLALAGVGATATAAFLACATLAARTPAAHLGIVQDWFTGAPAAAAAVGFGWLGAGRRAAPSREAALSHEATLYRRAAAFCVVVSLYCGACPGYWVSELPHGARLRPLAEGAMIAIAWTLAWGLARSDQRVWGRAAVFAWAGLLSLGLADSDPSASYREAAAFGLLGLALLSHAAPRPAQNFSVRPPTPRQ
jgi:hypothetical protein